MKRITLTFDNGPTCNITPAVLEALAERKLTAWFCLVGTQLAKCQEHVDIARHTLQQGHRLVNHSLTHTIALGDTPNAQHASREILDMHHMMRETLGDWGEPWFRPFGHGGQLGPHIFSEPALQILEQHDYSVMLWNSVPRDWEDPEGWMATALRDLQSREHTVIVLHDLNTGAMRHLPEFLDAMLERVDEVTCDLPLDCMPMSNGKRTWEAPALAACTACLQVG